MTITVNGTTISEEQLQAEAAQYSDAPNARDAAAQELILRELLLQRAASLGLDTSDPSAAIGALFERELSVDAVDEAACLAFYEQYPERFARGESASASHILFSLSGEELADTLTRAKAEGVLADVQANPARFADLAREHSSCPSGQQGGDLGQFGRGQMVAEFEQAVFSTPAGEVTPQLVQTQFGYHIIQVTAREEGGKVSFEEIKGRLMEYLNDMAGREAMHRYLAGLVAQAQISGYTMPAL